MANTKVYSAIGLVPNEAWQSAPSSTTVYLSMGLLSNETDNHNTWSSAESTDGNLGTNWSLGHVPTALEEAIFDVTSVINCTFTAPFSCESLTTAATYSGNFSLGGQTLSVSKNISFSGTGTLTFNADITITGDGDFTIGSGVGTVTASSCDLDLQGSGNLIVSKLMNTSLFRTISVAATGKITVSSGTSGNDVFCTAVIIGSGTFTINTNRFLIGVGTSTPITAHASATINGSSYLALYTVSAIEFNIPKLTITNTSSSNSILIYKNNDANATCNITGDLTCTWEIAIQNKASHGTYIVNTNDYTITTTGGNPSIGWANDFADGTTTFNLGDSIINAKSVIFHRLGGVLNVNLGSSTWNLTGQGNWLYSDGCNVDPGTSTVNFNWVGDITSGGSRFNDVVMDIAMTGTSSLLDAFSANNFTIKNTTNGGVFNQNGKAITIANDLSIKLYNATLDSTITMTGDGLFEFIPTTEYIGPSVTSSCVLVLQGNNTVTTGTRTISRLVLTAGKTYTWTSTSNLTITNFTAGDWSGSVGNLMTWVSSSTGDDYQIVAPSGVVMSYVDITDCDNNGEVIVALTGWVNGGNNTGFTWTAPTNSSTNSNIFDPSEKYHRTGSNVVISLPSGQVKILSNGSVSKIYPWNFMVS